MNITQPTFRERRYAVEREAWRRADEKARAELTAEYATSTLEEMGRRRGVTWQAVWGKMRRLGIPRRTPAESNRMVRARGRAA